MEVPASQDATATQEDVFHDLRPFVDASLSGLNAAIITYGRSCMHARRNVHCVLKAWSALLVGQRVTDERVTETIDKCAGQTGSGKTHTLIGTETNEGRGVLPRAVEVLWRSIAASEQQCSFAVSLTAAEIYCERIRQALWLRSCPEDLAQAWVHFGRDAVPSSYATQLPSYHCLHPPPGRVLRSQAYLQAQVCAATTLKIPSAVDQGPAGPLE